MNYAMLCYAMFASSSLATRLDPSIPSSLRCFWLLARRALSCRLVSCLIESQVLNNHLSSAFRCIDC